MKQKNDNLADVFTTGLILFITFFLICLYAMGCNASSISYRQREVRVLQKADSLNMKVAPAEGVRATGTRKGKGGGWE